MNGVKKFIVLYSLFFRFFSDLSLSACKKIDLKFGNPGHLFVYFVLFIFSCTSTSAVKAKKQLREVEARSLLLVEYGTNKVLLEKQPNLILPMASITKLGTALVSRKEEISIDEYIPAPPSAIVRNDYESRAGLEEKKEYKYIDLLHAMLIPSGNDAARTIANRIETKNEPFKKLVRDWQKDNRIRDFDFQEPVGISSASKATAMELMNVLELAKKDEDIFNILKKEKYTFFSKSNKKYDIVTRNPIPEWKGFKIFGKTGRTKKAGQCFAGFVSKGNKLWKLAILGSSDLVGDIKLMIEYIE
ncbi:MAG: serine hydrolase [Leptospiraceae bacterium]|nr:serine hydrolase [Leptospiraceae bacterium]